MPVSASVSADFVGTLTAGSAPLLSPELKHVIPVNAKSAYVTDLDNDGTNELLVGTYQSAGKDSIILYKFLSGSYQPLWNHDINDTGWGAVTAITTGDTDNDGLKEMIVSTGLCSDSGCGANDRNLRIFKRSSEELNSWNLNYIYKINELTDPLSLAVGDADNDGKNELIVGMSWFSRSILQFKNSGSSYKVSTIESTGSDVNSINIIDIDHDGLNEIVAGTSCWSKYNVGILKKVGSTWTRTWNSPSYGWSQAISGDLDTDGLNEILATQATGSCGSQGNSGFARIYKNNTEIWNYDSTRAYYIDGGRPAMGDLNGDGVPEFAFITRNTTHQILNIFTSNNPPFTPEYKYAITFPWISNPNWMTWSYEVIGDSDNNGINEIIMAGLYDGTLKIYELEPTTVITTVPTTNITTQPTLLTVPPTLNPLSVTAISPSTGTNDQSLSATVTGTGFKPGAFVKLTLTGQPDIAASSVTLTGNSTLSCTFDLTGKTIGTWDLTVTNPVDGTTSVRSTAFTLTASPIITNTTGTIIVSTTPQDALVYLDGFLKGTGSFTIQDVSPGYHSVRVSKTMFNDYGTDVRVAAGSTNYVNAVLTPVSGTIISGNIIASSKPAGANVYLDGMAKGLSPVTINGVSSGSHTISFTKTGYTDASRTVTITAGQTMDITVDLTKTGSDWGDLLNTTTLIIVGIVVLIIAIVGVLLRKKKDRWDNY